MTTTRGGVYWFILPAGYLGSSFWGMALILASTNLLTARIAAGCLAIALFIVLFVAKNWTLRGLCIGFIIFLAVIWVLQELTKIRILRYIIMFIGIMNSLFSVCDIYGDLISRREHTSDAEKFAEECPCCCNGVGWGIVWGLISFFFLCVSIYLGLVILSSEKDDSTDYPPVNDAKAMENEVDDLVKLTEQTLNLKKQRNHAKPRPVVIKLDEGENFIPTKKLESTDDLLSGAVREILINNEEVSTSRKGKEKVTDGLFNQKDNLENVEIRNTSTKRSNHKTRSKERKQQTNGENDDGMEERRRKGKKNSTRHNRPKEQKTGDSDIAVNPSHIPDFLL